MYPFLSRLVSAEPFNIDARALAGLEMLAVRMLAGEAIKPEAVLAAIGMNGNAPKASIEGVGGDPGYVKSGSVAMIPVWGVLDRTDADVTQDGYRVGTSYESIARGLAAAKADPEVGCRLMVISSPGGAAKPMAEFADQIHADAMDAAANIAAGGKPIYAGVIDLGASAALGLAVQATAVYGLPGTWFGSIGTRVSLVNWTERLKQLGISVETIKNKEGVFKDLGNPFRPMTEADRAKMQDMVDTYCSQFKGGVVKGRKLDSAKVDALATGEGWVGAAAISVGLMDAITPSFGALVSMLNDKHAVRKSGGVAAVRAAGTDAARKVAAKESDMSTQQVLAAAGAAAALATTQTDKKDVVATISAEQIQQITDAAAKAGAAGAAAERKRVNEIMSLAAKYPGNVAVQKLRDETLASETPVSVVDFKSKLLDAVMAGDQPVGATISVGSGGWEREQAGIEAAMLVRANPDIEQTMRQGGPRAEQMIADFARHQPLVQGSLVRSKSAWQKPQDFVACLNVGRSEGMGRRRIIDFAERCVIVGAMAVSGQAAAFQGFNTHDEILAAAGHSSSDFPKLLSNVAQKTLLSFFDEADSTWQEWCDEGSSTDFKSEDIVTLSEGPDLLEIPEGYKPEEGTFGERAEPFRMKTFGRKFSIGRQMLINDDLSGLTRMMKMWGIIGARLPEQRAWAALLGNRVMADGVTFFHASHSNLLASGTALSPASVEAAMTAMMTQRGFGSNTAELNIVPKILAVPTNLWGTADRITDNDTDPTASNANSTVKNVVKGKLKPIASPYLFRNSSIAWYLFGDKRLYPAVIVKFLNGNKRPIVSQLTNGSILNVEQEIIFDCQADLLQPEGAYKNPGA